MFVCFFFLCCVECLIFYGLVLWLHYVIVYIFGRVFSGLRVFGVP